MQQAECHDLVQMWHLENIILQPSLVNCSTLSDSISMVVKTDNTHLLGTADLLFDYFIFSQTSKSVENFIITKAADYSYITNKQST